MGCIPAMVAAGRMWGEDGTAGRAPMAAAFGAVALAVIIHARHWDLEPPRGIASVVLATVRSENLIRPLRTGAWHVDVVLASSPPYRVVARDDRLLARLRRGPIPRNRFEADMHGMGFSHGEIAAFMPCEPTESVRPFRPRALPVLAPPGSAEGHVAEGRSGRRSSAGSERAPSCRCHS